MIGDTSTVLAEIVGTEVAGPSQSWVGVAAIAVGIGLGMIALLRKGRAVSLERSRRSQATGSKVGFSAGAADGTRR